MNPRNDFNFEVRTAIGKCYEIGYVPTRFEKVIERDHPVEVAKKLVISGDLQYGIRKLVSMGRPELTVEAIMLQERFSPLFDPKELEAAKWRLEEAGKSL